MQDENADTNENVPVLESDEVKSLKKRTEELANVYENFTVNNADEYQSGAEHLRRIKAGQKEVETERTKITKPLVAAQRAANDFFRPFADRLANAERAVKRALGVWKQEQDRIAREAQRKVDEEARAERERLAEEARQAEEKGRHARAKTLEDRASQRVAPVVKSEAPKAEGISYRKVWKFRITDPDKVPRKYCDINETKIRKVVQALGSDAEIPGVEIYSEDEIAARA